MTTAIGHSYVVCIENTGYPAALELRKIYQRLSDPKAKGTDSCVSSMSRARTISSPPASSPQSRSRGLSSVPSPRAAARPTPGGDGVPYRSFAAASPG